MTTTGSLVDYDLVFETLDKSITYGEAQQLAMFTGTEDTALVYREFRTIRMGAIRQTGKSYWLVSKLKQNPTFVALFRDRRIKGNLADRDLPECQAFVNVDKLIDAIKEGFNVTYIVIDDASLCTQKYKLLIEALAELKLTIKPRILLLG